MQIFLRLLAVCGTHPLIWDAIAQVPGDWFAASRCCMAALKQTCYAKSLGGKKEKKKREEKKADCNSAPCFCSEAPPDPSCGVNWDSAWMLLPAFTARWVQFTCLIRFTLCAQVWSINIQAHITMQGFFFFSLFCLPSLTAAQIHQIQRKRLQFQWSSFSHPKPHWFLCWGFLTTPVDFSIGFHFILWFEGFKWELRDTSALSTAPLLGVNFSLNEKCMH